MDKELKNSLEEFTDTELEEELNRRKKQNAAPTPLDSPDWEPVKSACEEIVKSIINETYHMDDDSSHYVFEEAMKAVYGKDIFKWYNENV